MVVHRDWCLEVAVRPLQVPKSQLWKISVADGADTGQLPCERQEEGTVAGAD